MRITADTNVLLRIVTGDNELQGAAAMDAVKQASLVAISVHSLCELAWVLRGKYNLSREDVASSIRKLMSPGNVVVNRPAVEAGLTVLESGGDFADGVIAYDGQSLGGDTFVSFDKQAVKLLELQGASVLSLA